MWGSSWGSYKESFCIPICPTGTRSVVTLKNVAAVGRFTRVTVINLSGVLLPF